MGSWKRTGGRRDHRPRKPAGAPPGPVHAPPGAPPPRLQVLAYGEETASSHAPSTVAEVEALRDSAAVVWLDVCGLGDAALVEALGTAFSLHPLALEDVLHTWQRSKVEDYGDHLFVVLRRPLEGEGGATEQVALFLGRGFLLTFREHPSPWLEPVCQRVLAGRPRIRRGGADYLAYAVIDAVIDHYYPQLEDLGERLEALETEVLAGRGDVVGRLQQARRELLLLRRAIWPMREAVGSLLREETGLLHKSSHPFYRDCYDHTIQVLDLIEAHRELASSLMDLHLSNLSHRMNEVMKTLTIMATLFIPLGFIAGLYGMNFDPGVSPWNMPELSWYLGYPFALAVMGVTAGGLVLYFWRKGWLGGRGEELSTPPEEPPATPHEPGSSVP